MASTLDNPRYISLLSIDGISGDDIVEYARSSDSTWENSIAKNFPLYVAAIAKERKIPCFCDTGIAHTELADAQTFEVEEQDINATEEAYAKALETEVLRAEYTTQTLKTKGKDKASRRGTKTKTVPCKEPKSINKDNEGDDNDDDDDFETISTDEEDASEDGNEELEEKDKEYLVISEIGNQFAAAINIASELGLTDEEIESAFSSSADTATQSVGTNNASISRCAAVQKYLMEHQCP